MCVYTQRITWEKEHFRTVRVGQDLVSYNFLQQCRTGKRLMPGTKFCFPVPNNSFKSWA